jgi:hypothetical protein
MTLPPRQKTGRNDPCPCGSGRKYKQCCLKDVVASEESPWSQQRDASGWLVQQMLNFARQKFAKDLLAAWSDFNQDDSPAPIEEDPEEGQIFVPYLLFDWDPEPRSRRRPPVAGLIAQSYLLKMGSRLPELERLILEQAMTQPLSFYEVVRCDPGEGMVLRDVLIGGEVEVIERTASRMMRPGDVGYGQICELPEVTTLGRLAPLCIPPNRKAAIVGLREKLRKKIVKQNRGLTAADLIRYRDDIRTVYLDVRDAMRTPPRLTNTDGDPLVLHTLTFRAGSAHAAFEALAPLARGIPKKELLQAAKFGHDGTLLSVELPWQKQGNRIHKDWENTLLGHISISGRSLIADVNSEKRAERVRREIERRMGILVVHQKTVTQTPNTSWKKSKPGTTAGNLAANAGPEEHSPEPAFSEQMREELQRQVENWIFQKIPALRGRTPVEAIKDPDGKEIVESLLLGWERQNEILADPQVFRPDINAIRRLLKLAPFATSDNAGEMG